MTTSRGPELQVWVSHTYQVIDAIQAVNSTREDADKARRLYLVTGEDSYRLGFETAVQQERASLQSPQEADRRQRGAKRIA